MAFGNLTVDFRQLSKIPVRDRVTLAQSPQASSIFGNMSPSEIAALFPDYYKKFMPSGGGASMASGMTGAGYTGSGSAPTTSGATPASTGSTRPALIQEILNSAGANKTGVDLSNKNSIVSIRETGKGYNVVEYADGRVERRSGSRNWRNNNPGNIEYGDFAKSLGAIGTDGRFAIFATYEAGRDAKQKLLFEGKNYKNKTISEAINRYAPPTENNTQAYINSVISSIGVSANTPLSSLNEDQRRVMLDAMEKVEGFKQGDIQVIQEAFKQLPGTAPIDQTASTDETGIIPLEQGETAAVAPQTQSFDQILQQYPQLNEWYKTATPEEKSLFKDALPQVSPDKLKTIVEKYPQKTADLAVDQIQKTAAEDEQALLASLENKTVISAVHGQADTFVSRSNKGVIAAGINNIDERLVTLGDAGIRAFEKMNPGYTVRVISGKRTQETNSGSPTSRHLRGGAVDYEIIDPNGNALPNLGGGESGARAKAGFYAPKYEELGRYMEAARIKLAKDDDRYADTRVAAGLYFGGNFWMDSMHMQLGGNTALGDLYTGFKSPEQLAAEGQPRAVVEAVRNAIASGSGQSFTQEEMQQLSQFLYESGKAPVDVVAKVNPEVAKKLEQIQKQEKIESSTANVAQTIPTQSLPGTEAQTQIPNNDSVTGSDVNIINLEQPQQANTNMALGGTKSLDVEPNMVNEKYTIAQTDPKTGQTKPIANFNKEEEVNIKDGQMNVESAYKKKSQETMQKTDTGVPKTNEYNMRQSTDRPNDELGRQIRDGIVPDSPSFRRSVHHSRFGVEHFNRGAKSQYS
jgi:hypothetical protein